MLWLLSGQYFGITEGRQNRDSIAFIYAFGILYQHHKHETKKMLTYNWYTCSVCAMVDCFFAVMQLHFNNNNNMAIRWVITWNRRVPPKQAPSTCERQLTYWPVSGGRKYGGRSRRRDFESAPGHKQACRSMGFMPNKEQMLQSYRDACQNTCAPGSSHSSVWSENSTLSSEACWVGSSSLPNPEK